jgi:hypothetical protein
MLPTKWTIGLCAGATLIAALSPQVKSLLPSPGLLSHVFSGGEAISMGFLKRSAYLTGELALPNEEVTAYAG